MTSPMSPPPLDLDQVAALLAGLRPGWTSQGLIVRALTWRDARASWPQPLHTDRSKVAEPESVGLRLTAADGREARLVIWRGGWADADLLAGGTVTTANPSLDDPAGCAALASSLARQLTAPPPRGGPDLSPVTIVWVTDWWDGPVEGMASYQGRDCWFRAIFGTAADEWTSPRRCRLYELTPDERGRLWSEHHREQHPGSFHPGAPGYPARTGRLLGEFTAPPLQPPAAGTSAGWPGPARTATRTGDPAPGERWTVDLWACDVIVLYDWLLTVDLSTIPAGHKAHKQALADLLSALETQAPVAGVTQAQIGRAQHEVAKDMGW